MVDLKKSDKLATEPKKELYAIIKAVFDGATYMSLPLLMSDGQPTETSETVRYLTERGTTDLSMFKIPLSDKEYLIFSRQQLDKTLFKVEMVDDLEAWKKAQKPKKATR